MTAQAWETDPRVQAALADFERRIRDRYPDATFAVTVGDDPDGIYLMTTVDLEDTTEVLEAIMDRLLEVQVDEELPVYVIPVRPAPPATTAARPLAVGAQSLAG